MSINQRITKLEQQANTTDLSNAMVVVYADDYKAGTYSKDQVVVILDPVYKNNQCFRPTNGITR